MFKFLKSKKGFTLVELMIVVVIMAILVAVAVPIFSAVTAKARIKTCTANQREIASQLNNFAMTNEAAVSGQILVKYSTAGVASVEAGTGTLTGITTDQFKSLFQEIPYCPDAGSAGSTITVDIAASSLASDTAGGIEVETKCSQAGHLGGPAA